MRTLDRAVRWPLIVRPAAGRRARLDVYAHAALTVINTNRAAAAGRPDSAPTPVDAAIARSQPRPAPTRHRQTSSVLPADAALRFDRRARGSGRGQRAVRTTEALPQRRREVERIRVVERVVTHAASVASAAADGPSATVAAPAPAASGWPARGRTSPEAERIEPAQLATITDHVLTAIDRRLIAYGERLGRG
jgi:hypothetical protein